MKQWSTYQQNIFDFVKSGSGNGVVQAVAGSGKTTTIVEALKYVKGSHLFLAFNKSIALELCARKVNAKTFHSLTFQPVIKSQGVNTVNGNKMRDIAKSYFVSKEKSDKLYRSFCLKLVGLGKNAGIGIFTQNTSESWEALVAHHDLSLDSEHAVLADALQITCQLFEASLQSKQVDFDDLLYLSVKNELSLPKFDFIFVDEAQDTNSIQRAIRKKIMRPGSRIIAVGDPAQAIYGFRGSDSQSIAMIEKEFQAERFPLTVTYRCPTKVVEFARQYCDTLEAAPNAPEGAVFEPGLDWDINALAPGDLVVCRLSRPLIKLGYELLKARKPFFIVGQEFGEGLKKLVRGFAAESIEDLEKRLTSWKDREVQKCLNKDDEAMAEVISDKAECLFCLMSEVDTIQALERTIDHLFAVKADATRLSTVHKAKGLEADKVFWLNSSQCPSKWAKQEWQVQQELNICYVAATRAKKELHLIEIV